MRIRVISQLAAVICMAVLGTVIAHSQSTPDLPVDDGSGTDIGTGVTPGVSSGSILTLSSYTRVSPTEKAGLGTGAAIFNGTLYLAWKGMGNDYFNISHSTDATGKTISSPITLTNGEFGIMNSAPSLAVYNGVLYAAFTDGYGKVQLTSSTDGSTFSTPSQVLFYGPGTGSSNSGAYAGWVDSAPTLVVFDGNLYVFFQVADNDDGHYVISANVSNGGGSYNPGPCSYTPSSTQTQAIDHSSVGAAVLQNTLVVGMQVANPNGANSLMVCNAYSASYPGFFTNITSISPGSGISAASYVDVNSNASLYFAFKDNTSSNYLSIAGTTDGVSFSPFSYSNTDSRFTKGVLQINGQSPWEIAPTIVNYNNGYLVFYTANDNTHYIYSAYSE